MSRSILVVDDSETMRMVLEVYLRPLGDLRVLHAANGRAALEIVRVSHPTLVLTDLRMPEMDGFALLRAIQEDIAVNPPPVVVITSRARIADAERAVTMGAVAYLTKPIDPAALLETVGTLLGPPDA
jgi:CheY-like chemotaxis protein